MQIPSLPPMMMASYRLFWGPSVLAGSAVWLGQGVQLGWQAAAVLSDMLMEVANRFMQALGEGFYDPDEMRVPLTPRMTMAAAQLVLPAGLLGACLPRVVGLSRAFHDEECEDLSEVTWSDVAGRIGLQLEVRAAACVRELPYGCCVWAFHDEECEDLSEVTWSDVAGGIGLQLELDKLVALVEERLPVSFEDEDEDEDDFMDEDEEEEDEDEDEDEDEGDDSSSDEYTTDDEYMEEALHEQEQQQQLLPGASDTGFSNGLSAVQSVAWAVPGVVQSWTGGAGDGLGTSSQQVQSPDQQQQQQDAGAAPADTQQQRQQHQPAQDSAQEAGDATTHGVVLVAGFLEVILRLLLEAAGSAAQQQAALQLGGGQHASSDEQQQQQQGVSVFVTARHVLLGVAGNADLSSLLLHRSGKPVRPAAAAVAAAGVQQAGSAVLVDDPEAALGSASEEGSEDMMDLDIEPEALDLLAAAAEDFLVQQLAAAGELAVDVAGRQEVGPGDVRTALAARGHGHMLAQLRSALQRDL
ncbi:hypothetical protein OEZ85_007067 [Tetradesmus obliquus]|uniref:Uncharacterized protein n=1 Tax=Tetradesmus obliquus TaxID=3088 RepID=A0ABY8TZ15_TETOB|nr:hypothetical protein OEZ85_007067 [Tetradesmus obliquus]